MNSFTPIQVIILAAGRGSRMHSPLPKLLHPVAGRPMISYVVDAVKPLCPKPVVVIGKHHGKAIAQALGDSCQYVWQHEPKGTGDAVRCAKETFMAEHIRHVLVVPGDHPLINTDILIALCETRAQAHASVSFATARVHHFSGLYQPFYSSGRVIRNQYGEVLGIIELKDALQTESVPAEVTEVNVSYYCFHPQWLVEHVDRLNKDNAAHEYYLTDLVANAARERRGMVAMALDDPFMGLGVNTQDELKEAEYLYMDRKKSYHHHGSGW